MISLPAVSFLRRYVTLAEAQVGSNGTISNEASTTGIHDFLSGPLAKVSFQELYKNGIAMFLLNTSVKDRKLSPMDRWRSNELRFLLIAQIAKSVLCINASYVASKRCFAVAGYLIAELRTTLTGENISVSVLVRSWISYVDSLRQCTLL